MTQTLPHGYSSERTERELSDEYQHDRLKMDFKNTCVLVLCMKLALALGGLSLPVICPLYQLSKASNKMFILMDLLKSSNSTYFIYIIRFKLSVNIHYYNAIGTYSYH